MAMAAVIDQSPVNPSASDCNLFSSKVDPVATNEVDYSSIRGKNALVSPTEEQFDLLMRSIKERLDDGRGETIFDIGVGKDGAESGLSDDDYEASAATLKMLGAALGADVVELGRRKGGCGINASVTSGGTTGQFLVRRRLDEQDFLEVRHKHELESGRTSSVGNDILGFDSLGNVVNKPEHGSLDWVRVCEKSSKVVTFIDLAGHERYLKTTVFGMTGHAPDFSMLMVGSNAGIVGMTKEHLGLALALSVPVFVVVTKIDMCPANVLADTLSLLLRVLKSPGCRKVPVIVRNADDVLLSATNFVSERLCPIFKVSNVSGENLDLLKMFLNLLTTRTPSRDTDPAEFQIDDTYSVPGVGTVVSGTTLKGTIRLNDSLLLGPDPLGHFAPISVRSIHRKRMPVREVKGGQTASFALKKIKRSQIRKGMVMVSPALNPTACWEFEGEILVLHHPTTISSRYQAMVHCGSIRQTASILSMSKECLRTGDKARVHFRFIKHPEYLKAGQRMVFREGRTKAVGNVVRVIPQASPGAQPNPRAKPNKSQGHQSQGRVGSECDGDKQQQQQQRSRGGRGRGRGGAGRSTRPEASLARDE
ncbi:hypothetical protein J437_LFUL007154 [Ladona fulva]|uniref:GTP-binding protein 1 n=1 Tax=Ladona fulva TaxID=123851 RepID=A0A8K0K7Z4_LADFU|nr:hypothetical protein J437_LFUL007154 [Ladona fulva]